MPEGLCINPHTRDAVPNCFCHPSCVECLGPGIDQCTSCAFKQLLVQAHLTPDDRGYKQVSSTLRVTLCGTRLPPVLLTLQIVHWLLF